MDTEYFASLHLSVHTHVCVLLHLEIKPVNMLYGVCSWTPMNFLNIGILKTMITLLCSMV